MVKNLRFCFRIDKSVGLAQDENGNNVEAYACITSKGVDSYTIPKEKYEKAKDAARRMIRDSLNCDIELVTPITLNEYLDNTEEDEE